MKTLKSLYLFFNPRKLIRYKDFNLIISICIFVISSFILGNPVGRGMIKDSDKIINNYNYQVFKEIPYNPEIKNKITALLSKECSVNDKKILECNNFSSAEYYDTISFITENGITKNIHIVIDIFDIPPTYIGEVDPNYEPMQDFTTSQYEYEENVEHYLLRIASDCLYFQSHPYGSDNLFIKHNEISIKTDVNQVYYQSLLPDFSLCTKDLAPEDFGTYILNQLVIGIENKSKLKAYTLSFLVGVMFTLIIVFILWIFFRKTGLIVLFSEYYNIAAMVSIPISIVFFILLWFFPKLINTYIFIFSLFYVLVIYKINTSEEII